MSSYRIYAGDLQFIQRILGTCALNELMKFITAHVQEEPRYQREVIRRVKSGRDKPEERRDIPAVQYSRNLHCKRPDSDISLVHSIRQDKHYQRCRENHGVSFPFPLRQHFIKRYHKKDRNTKKCQDPEHDTYLGKKQACHECDHKSASRNYQAGSEMMTSERKRETRDGYEAHADAPLPDKKPKAGNGLI